MLPADGPGMWHNELRALESNISVRVPTSLGSAEKGRVMKAHLSFAMALFVCGAAFGAEAGKEVERLQKSAEVIDEIMGTPEKGIPKDLLNKSVCVGVIPSQKKFAMGLGGSYGRGCLVCRRGGTGAWGAPWMFAIGGPSIGFQLGGQATDFVLLVLNAKGAQTLVKGKTKLGADASVAGGPVGRTAEGSTGILMQTEILTYSRSRGAFAGLSLEGQVIKDDGTANQNLYRKKIEAKDILFGGTGVPPAGGALDAALTKYSPRGGQPFKK